MKKQGYLLLVLLMSAFVFCSCGQKDTKEAQDQTEETTKAVSYTHLLSVERQSACKQREDHF